jgi:hypothetical protein
VTTLSHAHTHTHMRASKTHDTPSLSLCSPLIDRADSGLVNRSMGSMISSKTTNKAKEEVKG